jgi:hypothetical protein
MTKKKITPAKKLNPQNMGRVSDKMRTVIEYMAQEGLPLTQAAEKANIAITSAQRALRKKHVLNALNQAIKEVRDNAAQQAYLRINHMAATSKRDRLGFDANRWVAGVDGLSPVTKVQGQHQHSHSFTGFEYPDLNAKDVTPTDNPSGASDDK